MFTKLWLRLGTWLGKLVLILIALGLIGWALATGWYAWQHRGPVSTLEEVPAGEAAMTQDTLQTAIKITSACSAVLVMKMSCTTTNSKASKPDRKSTRLNSSHVVESRMPSSA